MLSPDLEMSLLGADSMLRERDRGVVALEFCCPDVVQ